ncbi:hypothetical protein V1264_008119 [Littorina saxatilis]|uniref:CCHC-type domain-containing protein n=2 Tax=Littorina saxatilis TaxID=31220 RepID=A0AAN9ASI8_9CAEN
MATGGDSVDSPVSGRLRSQDVPTDSLTGLVTSELMRKAKSTREKLLHSPGREEGESITYYQKFMTLGTQMELKGDSLRAFADAKIKEIEDVRANKERLSLEKKKLAMEERKLEEARVEAQKRREFEESIAQKKREFEESIAQKQREMEEKKLEEAREEAQKQREMEEKKLGEAREEAQKQRDFEEAKVQRMERMESERIDEMKKLQDEAQRHAERLEEQRANNQRAHQKARDGMVESTKVTLPAFDENKEDIEAYLTKFERFAEELDWDQTTWARRVSTKLNVKATTLIGDMSKEDARDYQLVKKELLRGFRCTAESYREKFRAARRKSEETFSTYVSRITRYLHSWMDLAEKQRTYKDLFDLVLLEQLLTGIPQSVATFIRQSKATNVADSVEQAQCFVDARPGFDSSQKGGKNQDKGNNGKTDSKVQLTQGQRVKDRTVKCFGCGGDHFIRNCPEAGKPRGGGEMYGAGIQCHKCHKFGHVKRNCPGITLIISPEPEETAVREVFLMREVEANYKIHSGLCGKCDRRTQGETFDMTVRVNGKAVVAIRDTGSPMLCVSADLIDPATYTNRTSEVSGVFEEQGCMMPEEVKIEKFKALGEPKTKKEVRRFLGMLGFYRRYVPHFSEIALPLTNLTKGKKFEAIEWTPACQEAFERLKETLVSQPVVRLPDPEKAFVLRTDASDVGLGAVLLQADEKGDLQPVSYASKKLIPAEINYSTIEKECLAMVWGIRKFEPYLFGQHFTLMTDHQPLQYLQQVRPHNGRLTRWALQLQAYSFRVQTIKGVNNVDADFMSRVALDI